MGMAPHDSGGTVSDFGCNVVAFLLPSLIGIDLGLGGDVIAFAFESSSARSQRLAVAFTTHLFWGEEMGVGRSARCRLGGAVFMHGGHKLRRRQSPYKLPFVSPAAVARAPGGLARLVAGTEIAIWVVQRRGPRDSMAEFLVSILI